ncbi:arylamine N-acetyltransferase [Sporosarcina sp. HYO08]|uniref:arylamine N-acetyltransferase family protein n=1 Tax=Sporosarcina sp. HYO08 TaxID=1759557 RepID=UPI0007968205|nr:arylamine N-acetyltransferase [Sporosarcina sp. HYO08]KXH81808.1 hypothetical protein AU377_05960 [Sporosarcina sp. HYO08]
MDIQKYLKRMKATDASEQSLVQLAELQMNHVRQIPFENLDVIRKVPIYLNLTTIFKKLVEKHRGGYCYELNGLFHWLLNELGFQAHLIAGTVLRPNGKWAKADTHAAILVHLQDQLFLVDVGFGAATPHEPIPLNGTTQENSNGIYIIKKNDDFTFDLMRKRDGDFHTLYRFRTNPKNLLDFHEGCVFNQVSPASTFTHADIVTRATETGKITLNDQKLTIIDHGILIENNITTEQEKHRILKEYFHIQL